MKYKIVPVLLLAIVSACGGSMQVPLETTSQAPAAVGTLSVEQGPNQNTMGELRVEHLAPPAQLRGDLSVYVAWVRPVGATEWQNVGQLMVGDSRDGKLQLRVPYDQFELSLSAEGSGDVAQPSEFVVLKGMVDARKQS